ncbi:MAG: acyltransferase family protein [Acidimicrobiales bacterium]
MIERTGDQAPGGSTARTHLYAVDVFRFVVVGGVIAVHATSLIEPVGSVAANAVLVAFHVTREVFLGLSALVLTYSVRARVPRARAFWRRRIPLVLAPYVAWSAIYLVAAGDFGGVGAVAARFGLDLLSGAAKFHLYFLLVMLQLYLVFPPVLGWLLRHRRHHLHIFCTSLAFQLAFTALAHYRLRPWGPLDVWLAHPGSWLPSYQLWVVSGVLAALHLDQLTAWIVAHRRSIGLIAAGAFAAGWVWFGLDLALAGMSPLQASEVWQPAVVIESLAAAAGLYALGTWVAARVTGRGRGRLETSSDLSFGVYLAHPLVLQGAILAVGGLGISPWLGRLPAPLAAAGVLVIVVPAIYAATATGVGILRRTRVSVLLTGRPRRLPAADLPGPPPSEHRPEAGPMDSCAGGGARTSSPELSPSTASASSSSA